MFRVKNGINVGAAVTITPTGYQIGSTTIHSQGIETKHLNITDRNVISSFPSINISGALYDTYNNVGAGNSVLISTGIGVSWIPIATAALQGVQGVQGTQGIVGSQGTTGLSGSNGSEGAQGTQGIQGSAGYVGADGAQGTVGSAGAQGTTGAQGATGSQGTTGAQGVSGAQGATGSQGTTGAQGVSGAQGATGSQGTTGAQGASGSAGTQGTTGTQGAGGLTTTTASAVSAAADQAIVNQHNGNSSAWYGRILSKNSTSDKASFLGTYGSIAGVFAHNNALNAWADLYINTVDGSSGGTVRMPGAIAKRFQAGPYAGSVSSGNITGLEILNNGGTGDDNVAAISFHCTGHYGAHIHLRADSYFGVGGWSASSWRWYVQLSTGNMTAAGYVSANSDPRLKEDLQPITSAVEKISQLQGYRFKWKNMSPVGNPGKYDYGVLATDVEKVAPEIVQESAFESEDGDKYKTVAYSNLIPFLIESIKEQQQEINKLKCEINNLKSKSML